MAIRAKLVIIFFAFAVLPMFLLTLRWHSTAKESVTSLLRGQLNRRAQDIADQIAIVLDAHRTQISELVQSAPFQTYAHALKQNGHALPDMPLRMDLGAFLLAHQRQYLALVGLSQDGAPLFKVEMGSEQEALPRPYFKDKDFTSEQARPYLAAFQAAHLKSEVSISETDSEADGYHINLATPLQDGTGQTIAMLIAELRADQMLSEAVGPHAQVAATASAQPAAQAEVGGIEVIILNRRGTVLYASDPAHQEQPFESAFDNFAPTMREMLQGRLNIRDVYPVKSSRQAIADEWMIRLRDYTAGPQLSIFVMEKYNDAVGGLEWAGQTMIMLTFVLASVAMLWLYYLISGTTNSIRRVTRGAKAIAAGKLDHQITIKTSDETRVMADAFNRMAARLREMIARESEQRQFESFTRLSAVLTHDLKNAILSLSLLVSNMERKFDREGFREDAMRTLSDSVDNLQNLVAKLSDPLGQTAGTRQREDLSGIVERVLQHTAEHAGERYQIATTLLPHITAVVDAKAIERVVENLVINALEAMPDGGALRISTRLEKDAPVIAVADTGKGMSEEFIRERLFRPFATTKKKGIGLGLFSCRDIIEQHGGRIEVTSKLDAGTEFRIVLPPASKSLIEREEQAAEAVVSSQ